MSPYAKTILCDLGLFLHVPGVMALISLIVSLCYREYYALFPFLVTAIASLAVGQIIYRLFRRVRRSDLNIRHSMILAALCWAIIPLFGAIPFITIALNLASYPQTPLTVLNFQNPWNAIFESFSGFTSTGLSMALHSSQLPYSLQWWRSFTEWVGGVGVIVLVISILEPSTDPYQLYYAEGREKRTGLTVQATVRRIWWIYIIYTLVGILLLRLVGMPWWDALNHAMTGISTGGFSIRDESIGAYSPLIQVAVIPIMIAGAISFSVHNQLVQERRISVLWQDSQHRALWILLLGGSIPLLLTNYWFTGSFFLLDTFFQWSSALGTCGFNTTDIYRWSPNAKLLLSVAMTIGGASGSTVGGLKLNRFVFLFKAILWRFQRLSIRPHAMMRYVLDSKVVSEAEANRRIEAAAVLALLWISLLFIGVFILMEVVLSKYTLSDVIFEAASALGSVGLSTGITHPTLLWVGKLVLILFMWMGRLEIIPVLLVLSRLFKRLAHI